MKQSLTDMMKEINKLCVLMMVLTGCLLVSCSKDDVENPQAEQLVGVWKLDDTILSINADEPYIERMLAEKFADITGLLRPYIFADTIWFHPLGYFIEEPYIVREEFSRSEPSGMWSSYTVDGREIRFTQPVLSAIWYDRTPLFDCEDDLLVFYLTLPESSLEVIRQQLESEGYPVENLEIEKINYTQIYKKVRNFPYDE